MSRAGVPNDVLLRDDGCDLHGECLTCPLPRCRFEMGPGELQRWKTEARDAQIHRLRGEGLPAEEVARRAGVASRSVYRVCPAGCHGRRAA